MNSFGATGLPGVDALETFDLPREIPRYCDQVIESHLRFREAHDRFDDDWIPALKPYLGIAEHSCFLGGDVTYGGNTSYHHPVIDDVSDWETLQMQRDVPHYRALLDGMAYLKEHSERYGFYSALRGADGPMDIANAARGNDLFYDLYDDPETVEAFLDFCVDAVVWTFENQYPLASGVCGGYISGMNTWMPEHAIGHLSEDASCLCSPEMYARFGLPYTKKLLERYSYAEMHVHSVGRACLPLMAQMDKIGTFQLSSDPNQPDAIDVYREYEETLKGRTVHLEMTSGQVMEHLDFLRGKRTIIDLHAETPGEAERALEAVRGL